MSALVVVLGMVAIFSTAATTALVLTRGSREAVIRREIAASLRARADEAAKFRPDGDYVRAMRRAALIAEGVQVAPPSRGYTTVDSSRRVRPAGEVARRG